MSIKRDFFISYNGADKAWAEWIAWHLEVSGYETTIQAWDFRPGSNFILDMHEAASQCERTIAVLSPDYLAALYTQPEWASALAQDPTGVKGTLLPVRVRECELTGLLKEIVYIDLVGLSEPDAIIKLVAGAKRERAKPSKSPGFPGHERPKFPISLSPLISHKPIDLSVVVTYSSKDNERSKTIKKELEKFGIDVWRDQERIQVGAEFTIEIEQAIRRADAVIVLITEKAGESEWVRNEIEYAKYAKKPILPLLLDKESPPIISIMGLQHIPIFEDWDSGINILTEKLSKLAVEKETSSNHLQPANSLQPNLEKSSTTGENPFIYGGAVPVEFFAGRKSALNAIQNRVWHQYSLQSISIVSNRRMGKTSLLNYIWKQSKSLFPSDLQYVTVFLDAMDARAHTAAGVMRILRRGIYRQLQRDLWPESDDGKLPVLSEAFEELYEFDNVRLVLLLDEWESVMAYPELDSLLYSLRASGSRGWIGMITATAHRLSDLQEKGGLVSHFYNIFGNTIFLGNLLRNEWEEVVRKAFERNGHIPDSNTYDFIGSLAGGHPYLTQLAGSLLWQAKEEHWDKSQIHSRFNQESRMIFTDIWHRFSADHIQALKFALALDNSVSVPENIITDLKLRGILTDEGEVFCKPFADFAFQELR